MDEQYGKELVVIEQAVQRHDTAQLRDLYSCSGLHL
jgi:hypothetical protein